MKKMINVKIQFWRILLIVVVLMFEVSLILIPSSPGYFYEGHRLANIYLPDLGVRSTIATVKSDSVVASVAFMKIVIEILGGDIISLLKVFSIVFPSLVILTFCLLCKLVNDRFNLKTSLPILFYSVMYIFIYSMNAFDGNIMWFAGTLFPILTIYSWEGLKGGRGKYMYILMLIITTASLWWHTVAMFCFFIVVGDLVFMLLLNPNLKNKKLLIYYVGIHLVILISTWIWIRASTLQYGVFPALISFFKGDIWTNLYSIFLLGNFAGPYAFRSRFEKIMNLKNISTYAAYLILLSLGIWILLKIIRIYRYKRKTPSSKNSSLDYLISVSLIVSVIFGVSYLVVTKGLGVGGFRVLLYPLIIAYLVRAIFEKRTRNNVLVSSVYFISLAVLISSLIFASAPGVLTYYYESPTRTFNPEYYASTFMWFYGHSPKKANLITDATDGGHYQIIYTSRQLYQTKDIKIISINLKIYKDLVHHTYYVNNTFLSVNIFKYKNHLFMDSLQAWNKFEPLGLSQVVHNRGELSKIIYTNGNLVLAR